ncbi:MAG: threonylcarbamoyl-AMP synthase [Phycisphaerales bacterium]|nr:MAG: threonylcarbamoyl-AMP synthase [Phycisphaerales bacterium]
MKTEVVKADSDSTCDSIADRAAEVLSRGGLVAFPTETVYGVAARVDHPEALDRLRFIKERPRDKAFTVHIASRDDADQFVSQLPGIALRFIRKAWPGPLTLILNVEDPVATAVTKELGVTASETIYHDKTVGLRCPDEQIATAFLRAARAPVVAASANLAGAPPPTSAGEVLRGLDGRIDLLIDAGTTRYREPSTIVRITGQSYELLREGVYDARTIERLSVLRLLFVCTGNTCRSPMAAALAEKALAQRLGCEVRELSSKGVVVSSVGTAGGLGGAAENAQEAMATRGLDISKHVSTALSVELVQQADYVYAMASVHRDRIIGLAPAARRRVALLLGDRDVHDPIGGSEQEYELCAQVIDEGIQAVLQEVKL